MIEYYFVPVKDGTKGSREDGTRGPYMDNNERLMAAMQYLASPQGRGTKAFLILEGYEVGATQLEAVSREANSRSNKPRSVQVGQG